ncbi:MAG: alpha-L-rhamnosidase, partial [Candidatus Hydrogenedentes bacterium]|nr:alpha-L-rhamnosidase [Candidatus Hydrogenedentota bacterium]
PVCVEKSAPGAYRFDMGLNLSARPVLKLRGPAGSSVTVRVGELADKPWPGHSYTYTLRGGDDEWFRPRFTYFGFQYVFVEGADWSDETIADPARPRILEAASEFVTSSARRVGAFRCSNVLFNDIDAMIDRSVRSNLQSVLTDCPHREKLGWLEVSHLMGPSILYHYDAHGLFRKICRDTTESQLENGLVPDIAPEYTRFQGGFFESAEWGSACVQLPWLLYRWYGDTEVLARQFDTMAKYTRYLASTRNDKGLAKGGLGDWYDWTPEKGHAGDAQLTPIELTATAMLFDNARIVSQSALLAGNAAEANAFASLADQVRSDFITAYYDPAAHSVSTGSQAALSVGLHFGLVPNADRGAVLENLVRAIESMNHRPTTGEVCFRYMVRALADAGRSDVVYRMIDRTDPPGYGCMLRQFGLKTLSEQWDKPGSSLNHCMFGHIQEWLQGDVLGIQQASDSVGFERLRIAPTPAGGLDEASGHYDGPRGRIDVAWKKDAGAFRLDVTVPGNTKADVLLPVAQDAVVTEGGKPLNGARGVREKSRTANGVVLEVAPGKYRFEVRAADAASTKRGN